MIWHKLKLRTQLLVFTAGIITLITLANLALAQWLDKQERQTIAIELSSSLNKALSQDLLRALVNNRADSLSDLSFRLSNFNSIENVVLLNAQGKAVYAYNRHQPLSASLQQRATDTPTFFQHFLLVKHPLKVNQYTYGEVIYFINLKQLTTQLDEKMMWLLITFPIELWFGFLLAWWMVKTFTAPIHQLEQAMRHWDPEYCLPPLQTRSENEIKHLFDGFNQLVHTVCTTTQQLRYQSEHDQLTGLYNRFYIEQQLLILLKQDTKNQHALIYFDLDQFKLINDSTSHIGGDELLKMVANYFQNLLPKQALPARTDGDDFQILLPNTTTEAAQNIAQNLQHYFKDFRFVWESHTYSVSATLAVVCFQPHQYTLDKLIKTADAAFYTAKSRGHNQLYLLQNRDTLTEQYQTQANIARDIKEALQNNGIQPSGVRFELYAQIIKPLQTKHNKISYEILIRMWDAEGNFIMPDQFLPTAQRYQLMAEIDIWVLKRYLQLIEQHPEHLQHLHHVHINLAGATLNDYRYQNFVKQAMNQYDFPWEKLNLELTETSAVGSFSQARDFISWLKKHGIELALDDFGTGMSSFEYLKSLPFDVVKIDGSFIKDMHTDPTDHAVIRYIQEIASLRGQETVAEYVETQADVEALTQIGITYGQGYHLGKPQPLTKIL